jgi:hypothetical protein
MKGPSRNVKLAGLTRGVPVVDVSHLQGSTVRLHVDVRQAWGSLLN